MFREECSKFLDQITSLRSVEIDKAVKEALAKEHVPYVAEVTQAKDLLVEKETKEAKEMIKLIEFERDRKIAGYEAETSADIDAHKEKVVRVATDGAKKAYDTFILGVSELVDNTHID